MLQAAEIAKLLVFFASKSEKRKSIKTSSSFKFIFKALIFLRVEKTHD